MKVMRNQIRINLNGEVEIDRGPYIGWVPLGDVLEEIFERQRRQERCMCRTDPKECCTCISFLCHECKNKDKYVKSNYCLECGRRV